jgi:hypothetical protein
MTQLQLSSYDATTEDAKAVASAIWRDRHSEHLSIDVAGVVLA